MTRIIAGRWGGRRLQVPAKGTRPTSDRVREGLFSRLEHLDAIQGASVLDLYAGSGALGLEAASRGAERVVLVDSARAAVAVIEKNHRALHTDRPDAPRVAIVCEDAARFAGRLPVGADLDLVFLDPPYDLPPGELAAVLAHLARPGVLKSQAVVVVEQAARNPAPRWPPGLAEFDAKAYGETKLYFAEPHQTGG